MGIDYNQWLTTTQDYPDGVLRRLSNTTIGLLATLLASVYFDVDSDGDFWDSQQIIAKANRELFEDTATMTTTTATAIYTWQDYGSANDSAQAANADILYPIGGLPVWTSDSGIFGSSPYSSHVRVVGDYDIYWDARLLISGAGARYAVKIQKQNMGSYDTVSQFMGTANLYDHVAPSFYFENEGTQDYRLVVNSDRVIRRYYINSQSDTGYANIAVYRLFAVERS